MFVVWCKFIMGIYGIVIVIMGGLKIISDGGSILI